MTIQTYQFSSTAILNATYDDENEELSITFSNGSTYDYHDVPSEIVQAFVSAGSAGKFWHANIKDQFS